MLVARSFRPISFQWSDISAYLYATLFAIGNLVLPQLCHFIPSGGPMFLPIYFFTLIAAYKFGLKVGLVTAVFSPLLNSVLFGMPPIAVLPVILVKSVLLSVLAAYVGARTQKLSILYLLYVVLGYQLIGSTIEWAITQSFSAATSDLTIGIPGMLLQVFGGWLLLKKLALYEH
ncbi:MAG: ECF transporter S component [Candidatus Dadabacteria bacterium]